MKKILILILLLIFGWAGSTWFIGNQTESLLKTYMQNTKNAYAEMGIKSNYAIKDYKKSFFKSTATTIISLNTGDLEIDNLFRNIQFNNTITHGPVLLVGGSPSFGTAHIHSELDINSLKPETKELIKKLFANKNPLSGNITFGINDNADYDLSIPAIDIKEGESQFSLQDGIYLQGTINKTTLTGTAKGTIGKLHIIDNGLNVNISASNIEIDMQDILAGQMIGTGHFTLPTVEITGEEVPPISFGIELSTDTHKAGDEALDGDIKLRLLNIKAPVDIMNINFATSFKAFQIKGLKQLSAIQKDVQQLQAGAMNSNMSATEQEALMNKLQNLPNIMVAAVQNTLKKDKTELKIKADIASQQGNSLLNIEARYVGNGADINLEELTTGGLAAIQKIFNGQVDFSIPKTMLTSTPVAFFLPSLLEQEVIIENTNNYTLNAIFKNDEISLNSKSINATDFINLMETLGLGKENDELPFEVELPEGADVPIDAIPAELLEELSKQSDAELKAQGVPDKIIEQIKKLPKRKSE
jgi:hypothetical protein